MDVLLMTGSAFDLPSSRRVGAIVYDGTRDMQLWPGPGSDRILLQAYGPNLQEMLDVELEQMDADELELGAVQRVHRGKLHCDMLIWAATRESEPGTDRSPAPNAKIISQVVDAALRFAAQRNVVRIAFPGLGAGTGELPIDERLALIVQGAHKYYDECFASGRAPVIEEVLVCDPSSMAINAAKRRVANLAKAVAPAPRPGSSDAPPARRTVGGSGARASKAPGSRRGPPRLDPGEIAAAHNSAQPYDRTRAYASGSWMLHPKFGAGRVEQVTQEGAIMVLFEDGEVRKMLHARPS